MKELETKNGLLIIKKGIEFKALEKSNAGLLKTVKELEKSNVGLLKTVKELERKNEELMKEKGTEF